METIALPIEQWEKVRHLFSNDEQSDLIRAMVHSESEPGFVFAPEMIPLDLKQKLSKHLPHLQRRNTAPGRATREPGAIQRNPRQMAPLESGPGTVRGFVQFRRNI